MTSWFQHPPRFFRSIKITVSGQNRSSLLWINLIVNLLLNQGFFCYKSEAVWGFVHVTFTMDWETLYIGSCKFLSELELTLDLWAPIPQEFIWLAFLQLCKLAKSSFGRAIFDSICQNHPYLFVNNAQVSAFLFFYFYCHSLSVFLLFHPLPPSPPLYLNCTDNYDVAKIKMKSVTDHQ